MPTYEYRCEAGHSFEVTQRISDDPLVSCQTCSAPVQRVLHPVAVHFKGSGFYATDYGSRKRAREQKEHAESNGKKDAGDSSKSGESKSGESKSGESKSSESKSSDTKSESKSTSSTAKSD